MYNVVPVFDELIMEQKHLISTRILEIVSGSTDSLQDYLPKTVSTLAVWWGPCPHPFSPAAFMLPAPEALLFFLTLGEGGFFDPLIFLPCSPCHPFSPVTKLPLNPPRCSWECYLKSPSLASSLKSWKRTWGNSEMAAQNWLSESLQLGSPRPPSCAHRPAGFSGEGVHWGVWGLLHQL